MSELITWEEVRKVLGNIEPDYIKAFNLNVAEIYSATNYLEKHIPNGPTNYIPTYTVNKVVDRESSIKEGLQYIRTLASFLKRLEKFNQGFNRFIHQFPSGNGFVNQLHATIYLDNYLKVVSIEKDNERDADVTAVIGMQKTQFHIKTFNQNEKLSKLVLIDQQITEYLRKFPIYNVQCQRLGLRDITGVHSSGILSSKELNLIISNLLDQLSQRLLYKYFSSKHGSMTDVLNLNFGWDVSGGKIGGLNQFRSWPQAIKSVEDHVRNDDDIKHILIGITPQAVGTVLYQKELNKLKMSGVFFLEMSHLPNGGMRFKRSDIFLKSSDQNYIQPLLSLPLSVDILA